MRTLVDTNILLRAVQRRHPASSIAIAALKTLHRQKHRLCVMPQNLIEFWNVCTRPAHANGLGYSTVVTARHLSRFERIFLLLADSPQVFYEWKSLVLEHSVIGTSVHDARVAAAMKHHTVTNILTFDASGFTRYPHIQALHPESL